MVSESALLVHGFALQCHALRMASQAGISQRCKTGTAQIVTCWRNQFENLFLYL
jgi:hypothetical protein